MLSGAENVDAHLKIPQSEDMRFRNDYNPTMHERLFREVLMILLFLNKCALLYSTFYGNDVRPFVNMSQGLRENSQLKCEDSYLKLQLCNNRTFASSD